MMFLRYDLPLRFRPTENVSGNLEISRYRNQRLRSFQSRNITPVIQESQESPQNDSRISSNQDSNLFLRNAVPLITSWILNERNARNYISFFVAHEIHCSIRQAIHMYLASKPPSSEWIHIFASSCTAMGITVEDSRIEPQKIPIFLRWKINLESKLTVPLLIQKVWEQLPISAGTTPYKWTKCVQVALLLSFARLTDSTATPISITAMACILVAREKVGIKGTISTHLDRNEIQMEVIRVTSCFASIQ